VLLQALRTGLLSGEPLLVSLLPGLLTAGPLGTLGGRLRLAGEPLAQSAVDVNVVTAVEQRLDHLNGGPGARGVRVELDHDLDAQLTQVVGLQRVLGLVPSVDDAADVVRVDLLALHDVKTFPELCGTHS
jgi:hypothetical protein